MADSEFDLIARIAARAARRSDVVLGIGDDAALLAPPAGRLLAVTTDTLNVDVHFLADVAPAALGWKTLAVSLSDLAAMGAEPAWCLLSVSLPQADAGWLDGLLDGLLQLAEQHGVSLVGGDTTRGPLSLCLTAHGFVDPARALRRDGARVGDDIWVTGSLGDAAAALFLGANADADLRDRMQRPTPRVAAGVALGGIASAAIDVSDGLLADLGHICARSRVGAELRIDTLPRSPALAGAELPPQQIIELMLSGGDDYELCFCASPSRRDEVQQALNASATPGVRVGLVVEGAAIEVLAADGSRWSGSRRGFDHFAEPGRC